MDKPWLEIAKQERGVAETAGPGDNPRVVEYLKATTLGKPDNQNDETPWCSAFVTWCLEQAGVKSTKSAWARSYLNWGREPIDNEDWTGAVCILERGVSSGHVGFLMDWTDDKVTLLGGNQGDKVCLATFPMERVLGYRLPK
ncbi:MAG: TIGR02594 family protein [Candidatus Micrarchaeia archaeon]